MSPAESAQSVATIWLVDGGSQELFSHIADEPQIDELRIKIGQGIVGRCAKSSQVSGALRCAQRS